MAAGALGTLAMACLAAGCSTAGRKPAEQALLLINVSDQRAAVPIQELYVYDPQNPVCPPQRAIRLLGDEHPLQFVTPLRRSCFLAARQVRDAAEQTHQELVEVDLQQQRITTRIDRFDQFLWASHHHVLYCVAPPGQPFAVATGPKTNLPELRPTGCQLIRYWVTADRIEPVLDQPVRVLHRLDGTKCIVLALEPQPVVVLLNWFTSQPLDLFRLPAGAAISASLVSEDYQRLLLVLQFAGRSWNLFDLYLLSIPNRTARLLRANIHCPPAANSQFAPRLPVTFIDDQTVAFVEAHVTRRNADGTPTDGQYYTTIMKLATGRVLQRLAHPAAGLAAAPPEPHLPNETLTRMHLPEPPPTPVWPSEPGHEPTARQASENGAWKRFFTYQESQLRLEDGTAFLPGQIDMFRLAPTGSILAARVQEPQSAQLSELLIVLRDPIRSLRFPMKQITEIYWLAAPSP
jgi:hypothetical protein